MAGFRGFVTNVRTPLDSGSIHVVIMATNSVTTLRTRYALHVC